MIIMRHALPLSRHPLIVDQHIDNEIGLYKLGHYEETVRPNGCPGVVYELDCKFNFEMARDRESLIQRYVSFRKDWRFWYKKLTEAIQKHRRGDPNVTLEGIRPWEYSDTARWMMVVRHHATKRFRSLIEQFEADQAA